MSRTHWTVLLAVVTLAVGAGNASAGQFEKAVYYHSAGEPWTLAVAHLTQSGNLDLAVADVFQGRVAILLGNGDGTFQKPIKFSIPAPVALAVGDFNGDGKEDLAVVEYGGTGESAITILLGDGTGKFRQSASYPSGVESTGVAVADFNGDGNQDVAVANNAGNVMVFFGTGKGTLKKPASYVLPGHTIPYGIAAGDLNGNHHPDLAVAEDGDGSVAVLLNDGTGHFLKPVTYNAGGGEVVDVKIADLRNDGRNDLVIANLSAGMAVLLNRGNGTFGKPAIYRPCSGMCSAGPEECTVADFNLDGKLDVACAAQAEDSYFFYGKGDGTFGIGIAIADTITNQGGFSIAVGDFNQDNAPDLAIPIEEYGKVAIMLNTK